MWMPSATLAIGTLPELQTTNAVLQGITVTVADQSQLESMITFLTNSFDFKVLRQTTEGTVTNTVRCWMLKTVISCHSILNYAMLDIMFHR